MTSLGFRLRKSRDRSGDFKTRTDGFKGKHSFCHRPRDNFTETTKKFRKLFPKEQQFVRKQKKKHVYKSVSTFLV